MKGLAFSYGFSSTFSYGFDLIKLIDELPDAGLLSFGDWALNSNFIGLNDCFGLSFSEGVESLSDLNEDAELFFETTSSSIFYWNIGLSSIFIGSSHLTY
jgi:hypothetical protein